MKDVRKNILDLAHQNYLQFYVATIISLVTYVVGVGLALVTKQIRLNDYAQVWTLSIMTAGVLGIAIPLLIRFRKNIISIPDEIRQL